MYRDLNDYEMLYMMCKEKDDVYDILYQKYTPLIKKYAIKFSKTFKRYGYELDDLMQLGYFILYKASYLYNSYNSSMFYTYLVSSLNKAFINEYRNSTTNKKEVLNNALSYDLNIGESEYSYLDILSDNRKEHDNEYYDMLIQFKNSLSFEMGCVFELFYNGYSKEEISILLDEKIDVIGKCFQSIKKAALTCKSFLF